MQHCKLCKSQIQCARCVAISGMNLVVSSFFRDMFIHFINNSRLKPVSVSFLFLFLFIFLTKIVKDRKYHFQYSPAHERYERGSNVMCTRNEQSMSFHLIIHQSATLLFMISLAYLVAHILIPFQQILIEFLFFSFFFFERRRKQKAEQKT